MPPWDSLFNNNCRDSLIQKYIAAEHNPVHISYKNVIALQFSYRGM